MDHQLALPSETIQPMVHDAEIVDPPAVRDEAGQFLPGNRLSPGRPKSSLNRVTTRMRQELAEILERTGEAGNPLAILHTIAMDTEEETSDRITACAKLLNYITPKRLVLEMEAPDSAMMERTIQIKERLRAFFPPPPKEDQ
jgi:hypothetical protein